jgi:hypothetical protein
MTPTQPPGGTGRRLLPKPLNSVTAVNVYQAWSVHTNKISQ